MKVIKITKHTPEFFEKLMEDPAQMAAPMHGHIDLLNRLKGEGKLIDAYFIPGDGRAIFIYDFENESELDQSILEDPMQLYFSAETFPAVPIFDHIANAMKTME